VQFEVLTIAFQGLYLVASIMMSTVGVKTYLYLTEQHNISPSVSKLACFLLAAAETVAFGELYFRLIEGSTAWLARKAFAFLTDS